MYKLKNKVLSLILLFLLLNLYTIYSDGIGICHAQSTGSPANTPGQKNNMETARKLRAEGEALQKKGQLAAAIEKYELSRKYYPDPKLAEHIKILHDTLNKQYIEAAKKLRAEGEALQKKGQLAPAIEKYEISLKYHPDPNLEAHISKLEDAIFLSKKPKIELSGVPEGFPDEAALLEKLKKDPSRANIEELAALRHLYALRFARMANSGKDEDALKLALIYAKSAADLVRNNPDYWSFLGQLYENAGTGLMETLAEEALQKAVFLKPESPQYRLVLGQIYFAHRDFFSALEQFETIARKDPRFLSPPLAAMMCIAYVMDLQYSRGVAFFREILQKEPNTDNIRITLAILAHRQKNNTQATEELDRVIGRPGVSEENRKYASALLEEWKKDEVKP